jgi:hypothetical protein
MDYRRGEEWARGGRGKRIRRESRLVNKFGSSTFRRPISVNCCTRVTAKEPEDLYDGDMGEWRLERLQ